jgi:hypothetical protein
MHLFTCGNKCINFPQRLAWSLLSAAVRLGFRSYRAVQFLLQQTPEHEVVHFMAYLSRAVTLVRRSSKPDYPGRVWNVSSWRFHLTAPIDEVAFAFSYCRVCTLPTFTSCVHISCKHLWPTLALIGFHANYLQLAKRSNIVCILCTRMTVTWYIHLVARRFNTTTVCQRGYM